MHIQRINERSEEEKVHAMRKKNGRYIAKLLAGKNVMDYEEL